MIDSKTAVQQASEYFHELFPSAVDVRLEEVERSGDAQYWMVTFSFAKPDLNIFGSPVANPSREYKVVKLDATTAAPEGVKIKRFASDGMGAS